MTCAPTPCSQDAHYQDSGDPSSRRPDAPTPLRVRCICICVAGDNPLAFPNLATERPFAYTQASLMPVRWLCCVCMIPTLACLAMRFTGCVALPVNAMLGVLRWFSIFAISITCHAPNVKHKNALLLKKMTMKCETFGAYARHARPQQAKIALKLTAKLVPSSCAQMPTRYPCYA